MLMDCHRRIEQFLNILFVVTERAQGRTLTGEEASAAQAALQYFSVGGKRHNADEEQSLFPRLLAESSGADAADLHSLENDHQSANTLHQAVEDLYSEWIRTGALASEDGERLLSSTTQLKHLYAEHIDVEEKKVFPRASTILSRETIAAIGREFKARRQ